MIKIIFGENGLYLFIIFVLFPVYIEQSHILNRHILIISTSVNIDGIHLLCLGPFLQSHGLKSYVISVQADVHEYIFVEHLLIL